MLAKKFIYSYKNFIQRKGETIEYLFNHNIFRERNFRKISFCFSSIHHTCTKRVVKQRANQIFIKYMQDRAVKGFLKALFVKYGDQLHSVVNRLQNNVLRKRQRKQELIDMWEEQKQEIIKIL